MPGPDRTVCNSSQTATGTPNLDSFGNQVGSTGSSGDPYMFAATSRYRNDGDAGLTLVGARYYEGQVGRFISRDTVLTQKPYLYCNHDPVNGLDPSGHSLDLKVILHETWIGAWGAAGGLVGVGGGPGGIIAGGAAGAGIGEVVWELYDVDVDPKPCPLPILPPPAPGASPAGTVHVRIAPLGGTLVD